MKTNVSQAFQNIISKNIEIYKSFSSHFMINTNLALIPIKYKQI